MVTREGKERSEYDLTQTALKQAKMRSERNQTTQETYEKKRVGAVVENARSVVVQNNEVIQVTTEAQQALNVAQQALDIAEKTKDPSQALNLAQQALTIAEQEISLPNGEQHTEPKKEKIRGGAERKEVLQQRKILLEQEIQAIARLQGVSRDQIFAQAKNAKQVLEQQMTEERKAGLVQEQQNTPTGTILEKKAQQRRNLETHDAVRTRIAHSHYFQKIIEKNITSYTTEEEKNSYQNGMLDALTMRIITASAENPDGIQIIFDKNDPQQTMSVTIEDETLRNAINSNETIQLFKEIYKKLVIEPYLDITNQNHLDRNLPIAFDPRHKQLELALGQNRDLENFLFNDPTSTRKPIHTTTQHRLEQEIDTTNLEHHLAALLGRPQQEQANTTEKGGTTAQTPDTTLIPDFISHLDTYTQKRSRQCFLISHIDTMKQLFAAQASVEQSSPMIDSMDLDFTNMNVSESNIQQPILYKKLHTTISIDQGGIRMPSLLESLQGTKGSQLLGSDNPEQLLTALESAAQLSPEEIMSCSSIHDIELLITTKMTTIIEHNKQTVSSERIAHRLESELFVNNRATLMTTTPGNPANLDAETHERLRNDSLMLEFLKDCSNDIGFSPISRQQLTVMNDTLQDPAVQTLIAPLYKNNPKKGFLDFIHDIGLLEHYKDNRPTTLLQFFSSLKQMAHSEVVSSKEQGLQELQKVFTNVNDRITTNTDQKNITYVYQDKKIISQKEKE